MNSRNDNVYARALALEERRRTRARNRLIGWGAFLLLGALLGAVYATGFATTEGETAAEAAAAANNNSPAAKQDSSELAGQLSTVTANLNYSWSGRWGNVASAVMYEVDLSSFSESEKFFSEVVLTNTPEGFSDLQLQLRIAEAAGASCATSDLTGTASTNDRVMIFDTADAQVTFSGLAGATTGLLGGSKYCIGIVEYSGSGKDTGGTFIRKAKAGAEFEGAYPSFVATLNRMT